MLKIIATSMLMLGCLHVYSMDMNMIIFLKDQAKREAGIRATLQQTNVLAGSMASNEDNSPEEWLTLLKNCGQLEAALKYNLVNDKKEENTIRESINDIDIAFKAYLRTQKKMAVLDTVQVFTEALEKAQAALGSVIDK